MERFYFKISKRVIISLPLVSFCFHYHHLDSGLVSAQNNDSFPACSSCLHFTSIRIQGYSFLSRKNSNNFSHLLKTNKNRKTTSTASQSQFELVRLHFKALSDWLHLFSQIHLSLFLHRCCATVSLDIGCFLNTP